MRLAAACMTGLLIISGVYTALNLKGAWHCAMLFADSREWMVFEGPGGVPLPRAWLFSLIADSFALLLHVLTTALYGAVAWGYLQFAAPTPPGSSRPVRPAVIETFQQIQSVGTNGIFYALLALSGMVQTMLATLTNPLVLGEVVLHSAFSRFYIYGLGATLCTALAHLSSVSFSGLVLQTWGEFPNMSQSGRRRNSGRNSIRDADA